MCGIEPPVFKQKWQLPDNVAEQLSTFSTLKKIVPNILEEEAGKVAAKVVCKTMGNFDGYNAANAAEDLRIAGEQGTIRLIERTELTRTK